MVELRAKWYLMWLLLAQTTAPQQGRGDLSCQRQSWQLSVLLSIPMLYPCLSARERGYLRSVALLRLTSFFYVGLWLRTRRYLTTDLTLSLVQAVLMPFRTTGVILGILECAQI